MNIKNELPPNYEKLRKAFAVENAEVCYCYGDTIYNPQGKPLKDHLIHHESVHCRQQGDDIEGWWDKYIADPKFRVEQELEAYSEQLKFIRQHYGRDKARQARRSFATFVSGPVYANAISFNEAYNFLGN